MVAMDAHAQPEQLIAEMNRRRHWKLAGAVGVVLLALAVLFGATAAMYTDDSDDREPQLAGQRAK